MVTNNIRLSAYVRWLDHIQEIHGLRSEPRPSIRREDNLSEKVILPPHIESVLQEFFL